MPQSLTNLMIISLSLSHFTWGAVALAVAAVPKSSSMISH